MIPALASAFLRSVFLPAAFACGLCEGPPAPPPEAALEPLAPLHLAAAQGPTPAELGYLTGLEDGKRYQVRGPWLVDLRAAPERHVLSAQDALSLLQEHSQAAADEFQARYGEALRQHRPVALPPEERDAAHHLYWNRGGLLKEDSRRFLRKLLPSASAARGAGAACGPGADCPPAAAAVDAGAVPAAGPASAEAQALLAGLKSRLELDDHGKPEEKAALEQILNRMLESPTARQLAAEFIAEGRTVKVSFDAMADTNIVEINGKKYLYGTGGTTSATAGQSPVVKVNAGYLRADPSVLRANAPVTLAHELFGHALNDVRADKLGVLNSYYAYRNNETNAGVVGWTVDLEINGTAGNSSMWRFLADEDAYHQSMQLTRAYYASTLSPEEMQDPVPVLEARIARAKAEKVKVEADIEDYKLYERILGHFIADHGWKAAYHAAVSQDIQNNLGTYLPTKVKHLDEIIAHLGSYAKWYGTGGGKQRIKSFQKKESQDFLREQEEALKARKDHLSRALKAQRHSAPSTAPNWIDRQKELLVESYQEDRKKNPSHWP